MSTDQDFGIVTRNSSLTDDDRPVLVNIYGSEETAESVLEANRDEYPEAEVMAVGEFEDARDSYHVDKKGDLTLTDREEYVRMRDCVPPSYYTESSKFGRFLVGEAYTGSIHRQYARIVMSDSESDQDEVYVWRHVDAEDRSTWITPEEARKAAAAAGSSAEKQDAGTPTEAY